MPPSEPTLTINRSILYQELQGFGAAVGWQAEALVAHSKKAEIYRLLFADLDLDILRFRNRFDRSSESDNLSAEREIFQSAQKQLGKAPRLMLTSWSPPARFKANGKERCESNADCTLKRSSTGFPYEDFAQYWVDSLAYYESQGLSPDWISIQNEPDFIPPSWEGCRFEPAETSQYPAYGKALAAVATKLQASAKPPGLLGPEVLGIHYQKVARYFQALDANLLVGIAHHLYEKGSDNKWDWQSPGPDSFIPPMRGVLALNSSLPIYQTEFNTDEDKGIEGGFETAWLIHNSLVEENVAAFLYWELFWTPEKRGLIYLIGRSDYSVRDHYHALAHYARFTTPGDRRVDVTSNVWDIRGTAFLSPLTNRLTLILLNTGGADRVVKLQDTTPVSPASQAFVTVFRPGQTQGFSPIALSEDATLVVPSRSVVTVVLKD